MASSVITGDRFAAESFHAWETSGKRILGKLITGASPQVLLHWLRLAEARNGREHQCPTLAGFSLV